MVLPGQIRSVGPDLFRDRADLREVVMEDGIRAIGAGAFAGCVNLRSVVIPESVVFIGEQVFEGCASMERIVVAPGNRAFRAVGTVLYDRAGKTVYSACALEGEFAVPEGIRRLMDFAFAKNPLLTALTLPDSVTDVGICCFEGCTALERLSMGDSVRKIRRGTFCGCGALTSLRLSGEVREIGPYAFGGCDSLRRLVIPDRKVRIDRAAFQTLAGEESPDVGVVYPGLTPEEVPSSMRRRAVIGFAAVYASGEQMSSNVRESWLSYIRSQRRRIWQWPGVLSVILKEKFLSAGEIPWYVEETVRLGETDLTASLLEYRALHFTGEELERASRETMRLPALGPTAEEMRRIWRAARKKDGTLEIRGYIGERTEVVIPGVIGRTRVTSIRERAFAGHSEWRYVEISEGIEVIGAGAFESCATLERVEFPESLRVIQDEAFRGCTSLRQICVRSEKTWIQEGAFEAVPGMIMEGPEHSRAREYAAGHGIAFRVSGQNGSD